MEIFFEGIALRPWALDDAPQLAAIADNKKITDNLRDGLPSPYTLQDAQDWIPQPPNGGANNLSIIGFTDIFAVLPYIFLLCPAL